MKRIITFLGALLLAGGVALAQGPGMFGGFPEGERPQFDEEQMSKFMEEMEEMSDPVRIATKQADRVMEQVGLSDEQYKQVFKIYKQEAQVQVNKMQQSMSNGMRSGMMGGPGMMMGGPGGFNMADMQRDMSDRMKQASEEAQKEMKKNFDKRSKKMAKVLDAEQFNKWLQLESQMLTSMSQVEE